MGTNYYVKVDPCPCCGRADERLHIGKSSGGWEFLFAPYPERGLTTYAAWVAFLEGRPIEDEYGCNVALPDLKREIAAKQGQCNARTAPQSAWGAWPRDDHETTDPEGYRFCTTADFS